MFLYLPYIWAWYFIFIFSLTLGFCGFFDGDPANDLTGRDGQIDVVDEDKYANIFSESWR